MLQDVTAYMAVGVGARADDNAVLIDGVRGAIREARQGSEVLDAPTAAVAHHPHYGMNFGARAELGVANRDAFVIDIGSAAVAATEARKSDHSVVAAVER